MKVGNKFFGSVAS